MQCLKNAGGDAGGHRTGGDSADIIIPVRTDHTSYTNNAVPDRIIPCARCLYTKTCYLENGIDGCQARGCECGCTVDRGTLFVTRNPERCVQRDAQTCSR